MNEGDALAAREPGARAGIMRFRPPLGLRVAVALLALVAVVLAGALMISDRAPGLLVDVFGDTARELWDRIDARQGLVTDDDLPEEDFVVHAVVWAAITGLVALAVWSWIGLVVTIVAVFGVSVLVEVAQGRFSSTRSVESIDVVANGVGVAAGAVTAALLFVLWGLVGRALDAVRRSRRPL